MKHALRNLLLLAGILLVITTACRVGIPDTQSVVLGETRTFLISEELPSDPQEETKVHIEMGAGSLAVEGGAQKLVEGKVDYNVADWQPEILRRESRLDIRQKVERSINLGGLDRVVNRWSLQLGQSPIDLRITAGAYEGSLDLSGVPLTGLDVSDGASNAKIVFAQPNPAEMARLSYRTGASDVSLTGLGNANFRRMTFDGGAGSYSLDFSGALREDGRVTINGGLGDFKISVPADTAAQIKIGGNLSNVNTRGTWLVRDGVYFTQGSGPLLEIEINVGLGSITLISE